MGDKSYNSDSSALSVHSEEEDENQPDLAENAIAASTLTASTGSQNIIS